MLSSIMTEQSREHSLCQNWKRLPQGIIVAPLLIPIMLIASYQDKKALKKELDERQKEKDQASWLFNWANQNRGTLIKD